MIILLSGIFLVGLGLAVYALLPSQKGPGLHSLDESMHLHLPPSPELAELKSRPAVDTGINTELEQLKNEHKSLQAELELANNVVKNMKEELAKVTASAISAEHVEHLKKENSQLKDELATKDKELAELREKGAVQPGEHVSKEEYDGLNGKLSDALAKIKALEEQAEARFAAQAAKLEAVNKENAGLADKVKLLEGQAEEHEKREATLKTDIEARKNEGEQVPKEDLDALSNKLSEQSNAIDDLKKENCDAINKIKLLEIQIEQYKKEIETTVGKAGDSVPKKEYEELKKKLEEAEEILKIVHGSGE